MTRAQKIDRQKMVLAMEYIARQVNDEDVFENWYIYGVADGDIKYGSFDANDLDEYYLEDENFRDLMDRFLRLIRDAQISGGLWCGGIVTEQG